MFCEVICNKMVRWSGVEVLKCDINCDACLYYDHNLVAIFIPCIQETTCKLEGQQHNNNQQRYNSSSVTGGGSCVATSWAGAWASLKTRAQSRESGAAETVGGSYGTGRKEAGHSETLMRAVIIKWSDRKHEWACNFIITKIIIRSVGKKTQTNLFFACTWINQLAGRDIIQRIFAS